MYNLDFYKNKRILITGHTGFKGTWLSKILINAGAIVCGYSLNPTTEVSLFNLTNLDKSMESIINDVRDYESLLSTFKSFNPEIVIHLAAQPIVLDSYKDPRYTYDTNVMGTVNVLECIRNTNTVRKFLNVTTDKVYKNREDGLPFKETYELNGQDPYSNSKSCSELVTNSYFQSFLHEKNIFISTARAGNVIGGGDFSPNRIIPDCVRAAINKKNIIIRNPTSIRPYEHVLEALFAYLSIIQNNNNGQIVEHYNIGPKEKDYITTENLVKLFCKYWGEQLKYEVSNIRQPYESKILKLDCSKIKDKLGYMQTWNIEKAVEKTVEFTKVYNKQSNLDDCINMQIESFIKEANYIKR